MPDLQPEKICTDAATRYVIQRGDDGKWWASAFDEINTRIAHTEGHAAPDYAMVNVKRKAAVGDTVEVVLHLAVCADCGRQADLDGEEYANTPDRAVSLATTDELEDYCLTRCDDGRLRCWECRPDPQWAAGVAREALEGPTDRQKGERIDATIWQVEGPVDA